MTAAIQQQQQQPITRYDNFIYTPYFHQSTCCQSTQHCQGRRWYVTTGTAHTTALDPKPCQTNSTRGEKVEVFSFLNMMTLVVLMVS